ncbi:nuclear transport factor 2 family protein [Gordonia sp. NPDC003424]
MQRNRFDDYIRRFNQRDTTAFEDYIAPDMICRNGGLEIHGVDGMKEHYAKIWETFVEELNVERFVSDDHTLAVRMRTRFEADRSDDDSLFGPVEKGQQYEYFGVIMYEIDDTGRFSSIQVAYNHFQAISPDGEVSEMGMPH